MAEEPRYITGRYMGKEYVRTSTTKKGENAGQEFKSYNLLLKINDTDQYNTKIGSPDFIKGFDELVEGEFMTIGFEFSEPTYNDKAKKEVRYKNAFFIKKATEEEIAIRKERAEEILGKPGQAKDQQPQQHNTGDTRLHGITNMPLFVEGVDGFYKDYYVSVDKSKHDKYHFILTYLASKDPTLKTAIAKIQERYIQLTSTPEAASTAKQSLVDI